MAASGSTPNLKLPIYSNNDTPKFIPDFNSAMTAIDGGYKANKDNIDILKTSLTQTNQNIETVDGKANEALTTANTALESLLNINDITYQINIDTNNTGWTVDGTGYVKVVNGILLIDLAFTNTESKKFDLSFNYTIYTNSVRALMMYDGRLVWDVVPVVNGLMTSNLSTNHILLNCACPWNSAWVKHT